MRVRCWDSFGNQPGFANSTVFREFRGKLVMGVSKKYSRASQSYTPKYLHPPYRTPPPKKGARDS